MTSKTQEQALTAAFLKLTPEDRKELNRFMLILEQFRQIDAEMPLQQVITLITVALNPGVTVSEIARIAGNTLSSASRHVEALGPYRPAKKKGRELLIDDYDAVDRRAKIIHLTPKGVLVIKSLLNFLSR